MTSKKYPEEIITVDGVAIPYHKVDADANGNPRYVVHFLSVGVEPADYGRIPGLTKYRAKWFGGGIIIQSYKLDDDIRWTMEQVKTYYKKQA